MEQIFRKSDQDRYPQKVFANQLISVDDLSQFKRQLIDELLVAFRSQAPTVSNRWMKSHDVRKFLKISPGTLRTLKSSRIILDTNVGGVCLKINPEKAETFM